MIKDIGKDRTSTYPYVDRYGFKANRPDKPYINRYLEINRIMYGLTAMEALEYNKNKNKRMVMYISDSTKDNDITVLPKYLLMKMTNNFLLGLYCSMFIDVFILDIKSMKGEIDNEYVSDLLKRSLKIFFMELFTSFPDKSDETNSYQGEKNDYYYRENVEAGDDLSKTNYAKYTRKFIEFASTKVGYDEEAIVGYFLFNPEVILEKENIYVSTII
jgi:hypothetical protein